MENIKHKNNNLVLDYIPNISVVIPVFNENQEHINITINSILKQKNINLDIIIIDDGSDIPLQLDYKNVRLFRLGQNCGKRYAQVFGMHLAKYDYIATIDSDTTLNDNAIYELYRNLVQYKLGAITGSVYLSNEKKNILTRMTSCMYWFSFYQERASQSYFGSVTCCSGALSLYKKQIILQNKDKYLNQKFLGIKCDAGDDRHLTNLFLLSGQKVGWCPTAIAYTHSPETIPLFIKQQLRWVRSQIAALYYLLFNFNKMSIYFMMFSCKLIYQNLYMLLLYVTLIISIFVNNSFTHFMVVLFTVVVITTVKIIIAYLYTKNINFINLLLFSLFSFFIFSPIMIYGIFTPTKVGWGTRKTNIIKESGK